ncbi:hypothetical protein LTR56_004032 [Elasticomyces elasticus]|nr:hypothetical protein LTR56_004032 [Elasticomyces elasticus]KAK3661406.1 hypothetical protein LTR22_007613 [Elasticomyces elasticus]KAK4928898.1 hypothetical protein LTR49_004399 [Elasticomyces elasticus]KAK5765436.1 hypothetical protein LTS12_004449 [Elasticomyces elasticus]
MSNLVDLVHIIPPDRDEEPEDIFASAPGLIFTDDTRDHHGDLGSVVVYKSNRFGHIELRTADPDREDERQLFSHYLWNAGIKMAELISDEQDVRWSVKDEKVLELGAGVGLNGIVATLSGAQEAGTPKIPLAYTTLNTKGAIPQSFASRYRIEGHEWGDLTSPFAQSHEHSFTRIIAADCYWMLGQHENLVQSMLHFLAPSGWIFVTSGFHTGRAKLANFFEVAVDAGLGVEQIYDEDVSGIRRSWKAERDGGREDVIERKRWLVIALLRRRAAQYE